ncbi:hypothetical protein CFO_g3404 [Ceratocystis platani]|uniref:Uncharacterized protein n=1 Tax=Ceratocystis fimbriata f. sp. platani TaxID=88771 RepID=A0A0F8CU61_CERFI|nr:hypothetical protein CFO_g3404 [Ceratocystis platani]
MVAEESKSHEDPSATCPIRYLDKHTPEEIAQYVEKHKHQIPRSHEICVRRYQQSDEQVRKLDAKYGNLVSMIEGLSQLHKPMLASEEAALEELRTQEKRLREGVGENGDGDSIGHGDGVVGGGDVKSKTQRVEQWAQAVGQSIGTNADTDPNAIIVDDEDGDRGRPTTNDSGSSGGSKTASTYTTTGDAAKLSGSICTATATATTTGNPRSNDIPDIADISSQV